MKQAYENGTKHSAENKIDGKGLKTKTSPEKDAETAQDVDAENNNEQKLKRLS
ncbi:hypothetical protein [Anoxynatronum sibiricum]|uniref:Uncharacterized protein n=1 Tax=Anoxynatronum sibiricum TaxID=210623 RepID=A0ABU9VSH7_9CLOT